MQKITVNIEKLVDKIEINTNDISAGVEKMKKDIEEALIKAVIGFEVCYDTEPIDLDTKKQTHQPHHFRRPKTDELNTNQYSKRKQQLERLVKMANVALVEIEKHNTNRLTILNIEEGIFNLVSKMSPLDTNDQ